MLNLTKLCRYKQISTKVVFLAWLLIKVFCLEKGHLEGECVGSSETELLNILSLSFEKVVQGIGF